MPQGLELADWVRLLWRRRGFILLVTGIVSAAVLTAWTQKPAYYEGRLVVQVAQYNGKPQPSVELLMNKLTSEETLKDLAKKADLPFKPQELQSRLIFGPQDQPYQLPIRVRMDTTKQMNTLLKVLEGMAVEISARELEQAVAVDRRYRWLNRLREIYMRRIQRFDEQIRRLEAVNPRTPETFNQLESLEDRYVAAVHRFLDLGAQLDQYYIQVRPSIISVRKGEQSWGKVDFKAAVFLGIFGGILTGFAATFTLEYIRLARAHAN